MNPEDPLMSEREVRNMLGGVGSMLDAGFPRPAQIGPRGRRWLRSAVTQWALTQQVGQAQSGETDEQPKWIRRTAREEHDADAAG